MTAPRHVLAGRQAGGFTVVEVLAALVLVAIVLPAAVHGTMLCLDTAAHASMQAQAASLAQAKLSELAAAGQFDEAMQEGDFGEQFESVTRLGRLTPEAWMRQAAGTAISPTALLSKAKSAL